MDICNRQRRIMDSLVSFTKNVRGVNRGRNQRIRMGAVIALKNGIIAFGCNQEKTHTLAKRYSRSDHMSHMHAELDAILHALHHLSEDGMKDCTIYVCRVKADGSLGLAMPCENCQKLISRYRIKRVVFSTDEQTWVEVRWREL